MGIINTLLRLTGSLTFNQPWVMTGLFAIFYCTLGLVSLQRPAAALVMYFGTVIMNPQIFYPLFMDVPLAKIVVGWCFLVFLINSDKLRPRWHPLLWLMLAFLATSLVSAQYALSTDLAQPRFLEFNAVCLMIILTIFGIKDQNDYNLLTYGVLGSIFYNVLRNLVQTQTEGIWVVVKGTSGWLRDSNDWALALAMALPMFYAAVVSHWSKSLKLRIFYSVATLGALLTLTMTSSRGGFLAAAISGTLFLLMDRKPAKAMMVAALMVVVVSMHMPNSFRTKLESFADMSHQASQAWNTGIDQEAEYTGAERVYFWKMSLEIMLQHPLTGVGWSNLAEQLQKRLGLREGLVAHSTWFQVGAEAGVTGLATFLGMIAASLLTCFNIWRHARRCGDSWRALQARVLFCGLVAYCVGGTFISREYSELLFLYIAMTVTLRQLPPQETAAPLPATSVPSQTCPGQ